MVIHLITTIIRTVILYILVTFSIRLMGKRQIGDMQPNELVVTFLLSEIAAIPLQDTSQPLLSGVVSIFMLVVLEIIISVFAMKSQFMRRLISGKSVVIIKNGEIDQTAMKNVRMTVLDLIELLRSQSVFDLSTIAFAVLEVNGELSVLLKSSEQPATAADVGAQIKKESLPLPVITDGQINYQSLKTLKITEQQLLKKLKKHNTEPENVFLMTMDHGGNSNITKKRLEK